ncbi:hypothetical protein J2Z21_000708 [Streptomyces griseochromogenes]|uniref:Uncharacterized protein n=1 Tax=Streptomyces griseochromogenes TaxID=68214 RepID=A0ABS4LK81_9ACTN|nr:hypothetical protein [Streptomyces griseochromogenes]MBP2047786.1 hypothetical protein [Streptomyces griseochromogenes]
MAGQGEPAAEGDSPVPAEIGARDRIQAVIFAYDHGLARLHAGSTDGDFPV